MGSTFPKQKELTDYLALLEEAKKRDHRKIGKEMELFTFSQKVGLGLPLWLPKGALLRERLEMFLKKVQKKAGYQQVICPHIGNVELYKTIGTFQKYGESFFPSDLNPGPRGRIFPETDELSASLRNIQFQAKIL